MYFKAVADIFERHKALCGYPEHQLVSVCVSAMEGGEKCGREEGRKKEVKLG